MDYDFSPECLEKEGFEGKVTIQMLPFTEKLRMTEKCAFKMKDDGSIDVSINSLGSIALMIENSKPYVKAIDIKSKDGKYHFKSFDELQFGEHPACGTILIEISGAVLGKGKVSGN